MSEEVAVTAAKKGNGLIVWLIVGIVGLVVLASYISESRKPFLAWKERRADWLSRCERYTHTPLSASADARACNTELGALMTEARSNGWTH